MAARRSKIRLLLQLLPVIIVAIAGIVGAAQLQVVREFLASASGEEANIVIDPAVSFGTVQKPWQNLAQGGEMSNWTLEPIQGKVKALQPRYIRIDHIYSFYDVVKKEGDKLTFDFTKLDVVVNGITATGAKPYIALSYMPAPLAVDGQITSPPQRWEDWQELVRATIHHYSVEKGISDVYYEVWNEPDLFGGWKTYGDRNYLTLYTYAARGQAQVRGGKPYKFGGPGVTALYENWFNRLVEHAENNNLRLDFFSWHRYNLDIEQYRKDFANAIDWRSKYPSASDLELHITEAGHDSNVHPGYDTNFGAAHTAAMALESVGNLDKLFPFEIEDGKSTDGRERWGRWGVLTHRDFGNNIKPRYLAIRLLNRIQGDQVQLLGKGTWVKALATRNGNTIEIILANYDQYGKHVENVPITIKNVVPGTYTLEITDLGGSSRQQAVTTETTDLVAQIFMGANSINFVKVIPPEGTTPFTPGAIAPAPSGEAPEFTEVINEGTPVQKPENTPVENQAVPVGPPETVPAAGNPFLGGNE